jgi:hypothetical protein
MPIKFEFTGRDTSQRNYLAKVGLATIASRERAIMSAAAIPKELHQNFWREAFLTSTYLDGLILVEIDGALKTQFEHWEGTLPQFLRYLRKWGEARVMKLRTLTTPKIYDRRKVCMFVGYSPNLAGDTFRMWDPETKQVHVSRDIIWLNRMYFNQTREWINVPRNNFTSNDDYDSDNVQLKNENNNNNEDEEISNEIEPIVKNKNKNNERITTRSGRVIQLPYQFREELDNFLFEEEQEKSKNDNLVEMLCIGAGIGEVILHTGELHVLNYKNAMTGDDRENWKKAIDKVHERMIENKVWIPRKLKDLPVNAKLLTTTWAKKKANRQYRARIRA